MDIPVPQQMAARFRQAVETFYLSYCDDDARDNMVAYIRDFSKPYSVASGDHADRMEILVKYANTLPEMDPPMTDNQKKRLFLNHTQFVGSMPIFSQDTGFKVRA